MSDSSAAPFTQAPIPRSIAASSAQFRKTLCENQLIVPRVASPTGALERAPGMLYYNSTAQKLEFVTNDGTVEQVTSV